MDKLKLRKISKVFIIIGLIVLLSGVISIIVGFTKFGISISSESIKTGNGLLIVIGTIILVIGILLTLSGCIMMLISHTGEVVDFTNEKVIPTAKYGINQIEPTIQKGVDYVKPTIDNLSKSFDKGLEAAKAEYKKNKEGNSK